MSGEIDRWMTSGKTDIRCKRCNREIAPANGIWVHVDTERPESFETGHHYANPNKS